MGEDIKRLSAEASNLKTILLQNSNIDILLYLAKYNPNVTLKEIVKRFGIESENGVKSMKGFNLIKEENHNISLTEEGIFQVEGLITLAV